jgi:hypothetical protein
MTDYFTLASDIVSLYGNLTIILPVITINCMYYMTRVPAIVYRMGQVLITGIDPDHELMSMHLCRI